jgi:parvulin-like peptidyl-prolyl isomerase
MASSFPEKPVAAPLLGSRLASLLALLMTAAALTLSACGGEDQTEDYVARVGDDVLTEAEVSQSLSALPTGVDTAEARQQIVEQWVTRTLLLREAERLNLRDEPDVQRQIRQQERSILVTALTDRMYQQAEVGPTEAEIRNYFQSNRDQLTLREPFVRVRHLAADTRSDATAARTALQDAARSGAPLDSTFRALVRQYAEHPEKSRRLAGMFVPESRLFGHHPYLRDELAELGDGQISPVVEDDSLFHVLQLVERVPEGAEPELAWVRDQIERRLTIRSRKQMYAREVQQLRNQAAARNELDVRAETGGTMNLDAPESESPPRDTGGSDAEPPEAAPTDAETSDAAQPGGEPSGREQPGNTQTGNAQTEGAQPESGNADSPGEEPASGGVNADQPAAEAPPAGEAAPDQPTPDEPATGSPAADDPAADDPAADDPAADAPAAEEAEAGGAPADEPRTEDTPRPPEAAPDTLQ